MTRAKRRHLHQKRRKLYRLGNYLTNLLSSDPAKFYHEWNIRLTSWIELVHLRGRMLRSRSKCKNAFHAVAAVLENVEWFLATFPDINKEVGSETCNTLQHEMTKIFADVNDKRLYRMVKRYCVN